MKPKIILMTLSYPHSRNDSDGNFIREFALRMTSNFDVYILTPEKALGKRFYYDQNIKIIEFKYWPFNNKLTDGNIIANLKNNKLLYLQILPLILAQFIQLSIVVKREKINLIHAHWLIPQAFVAVLYKYFLNKKIKVLCTGHGSDINNLNMNPLPYIKKWILKNVDGITVVSKALKSKLIYLNSKKHIHVFPMGIDTSVFTPEARNEEIKKKWKLKGRYILYVGGLIKNKGVDMLVEAMPNIFKNFPDLYLVLVGNGGIIDELKSTCAKLKISEKVFFTGTIPNSQLPPYFATAELFVLPSKNEGFGLVIAEALSCETPALASDLDAVHDIIKDGKNGFFINDLTSTGISNQIIELLNEPEILKTVKSAGRQEIINRYDWKIVSKNYSNLINELITK